MTDFKPWAKNWQISEILPVIPPNATLSPDTKVSEKNRGKSPGKKVRNDWVGFGGRWSSEFRAELSDVKRWHSWNANVGLQTRIFHAIDLDLDDEKLAAEIESLALDIIGDAPVRTRQGSARRLLLFRIKDGHVPLRKRRLVFDMPAARKQAVELLGMGQQCVVGGIHPSGALYEWRNWHPCDHGPSGLSEITAELADAFYADVVALLDMMGYPTTTTAAGAATPRKGLDEPALHAPSPEHVLEALEAWRPDDMGHDEYVAALCAIKAALGPARDEYKGEVLEWSPGVRSSEPEEFEKRWNSINDSTIGWEWLASRARASGYSGDAQTEFDDGATEAGSVGLNEGALDRMLNRYVWCQQLERYVDLASGEMLSAKSFNAANTDVAQFGRAGPGSAEAEFQNSADARKVVMPTYRPGQGELITDTNERGKPVKAVNLWRPSSVVPAKNVTNDDVKPWTDHVELIFGPLAEPAAQHFLNWCAHVLQFPGRKISHALVIFGETQGTGKDTVFVPVLRAVGMHNVATITPETLNSPWTHYLLSQVVRVEEMMNFSRREVANKLKPMLATPPETVSVNTKNVKQYDIPNIQCWIMFTNYENAIPVEDTDRRYWIQRCCLDTPRPPAYYAKIYGWYDNGGTEKVAGWLMARDISAFNPMAAPPMTQAKRDMLEASQPAPVRWMRDQLREGGKLAHRTALTTEELKNAANGDWEAPTQNASDQQAMAALRAEGFKAAHRVRLTLNPCTDADTTGMRQLWARGVDGAMTAKEMRALYEKERGMP